MDYDLQLCGGAADEIDDHLLMKGELDLSRHIRQTWPALYQKTSGIRPWL